MAGNPLATIPVLTATVQVPPLTLFCTTKSNTLPAVAPSRAPMFAAVGSVSVTVPVLTARVPPASSVVSTVALWCYA